MATWRDLISEELLINGDSWSDVVHNTLSQDDLDIEFDDGFGSPEGKPFCMWTEDHVYFPHEYDGAETCCSAPRNPGDVVVNHGYC